MPRCNHALPQVRYDNAGIFGSLPDDDARQQLLYTNNGQGEVVMVNITPDKKLSAPVRHTCGRSARCRQCLGHRGCNFDCNLADNRATFRRSTCTMIWTTTTRTTGGERRMSSPAGAYALAKTRSFVHQQHISVYPPSKHHSHKILARRMCLCMGTGLVPEHGACSSSGMTAAEVHASLRCRYVRSLDSKQLGGKNSSSSACDPLQYVNDQKNSSLPNNGKINPCGLIAWSNFNDTFSATVGGQALAIDVSTTMQA